MHVLIPALHRPSKPTGVCRHAANLAQCLANTDEVTQVTLVIGEWQTSYFAQSFNLISPKIKLISVSIKNSSLSRNQWFLFGWPKLANSLEPDVIHMSFPFPFIRQWLRSPVVSTIHDLYPYECPKNFGYPQVWFNRGFLKQCVDSSDGLACVSQITLNSLKHYFPVVEERKKTAVIYNYADLISVESTFPTKINAEFSAFILCVAQHRKNKNLDLLIHAYAQLLKDGNLSASTKLVLVGSSGPETENLLILIENLVLQDQVEFLSALTDQELCWLYKHCKLFVIASSTEGFCLPLVEALSLGCRVVCSDIPILREVGTLACNYFDLEKEPVENLANSILSSLKQALGDRPPPDIRFSKRTIAKQLLEFYNL